MTLPLFDLFQELREPLSLQLEQYFWLLEAIKKGFGCGNIDELKSICRLLWLKSVNSEAEKQFETIFKKYLQENQKLTPSSSTSPSPQTQKTNVSNQNVGELKTQQNSTPTYQPPRNKSIIPQQKASQIRLTSAYQTAPPIDITQSQQGYILKVSDFPFLERQTRHSWLRLHQPLRRGKTQEIDIPATVHKIGRNIICNIICVEPEYETQRLNQTQLIFLEDREGSMIPFRPIIDSLFNTVEPKKFAAVNRYYFRNCPRDFVYLQPKGTDVLTLERLPLDRQSTVLVIISDAGAARGGYNPGRVEMTQTLLNKLQPQVKTLFWLNPIPSIRWTGTTAAAIYQLLEGRMFEIPQGGIQAAITRAKQG
jgi:uncharacterized protein with von Willebrand factor type A (vWA) domain